MSTISLFDSTIYRHMFTAPAMAEIFSEHNGLKRLVDVERSVTQAQGEIGLIPRESADTIVAALDAGKVDLDLLNRDTLDVGRPIAGLVKQLVAQVPEPHAAYVHYGVTTYDTMDTARSLQIRDGLDCLGEMMVSYRQGLMTLSEKHRLTIMIARTNNLHAQPQTFGVKVSQWIEELLRHEERLQQLRKRVLLVQFGGAVGTLAALHPHGITFRRKVAELLDLGYAESNWHNARDGIAELGGFIAGVCASLARNAQVINALSGTDIGELSESGQQGRGRSTTMPHKRNPRAAEFAEATARLGRQRASGLVEVVGEEHDRCGGTYICEWMMLPEALMLCSAALSWAIDLLDRLEVHVDVMRANVDKTNGLIMTERYTMALSQRMSKLEARKLIDEAVKQVFATGRPIADILSGMPSVTAHLSSEEIASLGAPENYVGASAEMVDNTLAAARAKDVSARGD